MNIQTRRSFLKTTTKALVAVPLLQLQEEQLVNTTTFIDIYSKLSHAINKTLSVTDSFSASATVNFYKGKKVGLGFSMCIKEGIVTYATDSKPYYGDNVKEVSKYQFVKFLVSNKEVFKRPFKITLRDTYSNYNKLLKV